MARQSDIPAIQRLYFRDIKPYAVVDTMEQLTGPAGGVVVLPHAVLWAPSGGRVDLDVPGGTALVYQAVLAEGTREDLERVINRERLVGVWSELMLPVRVRDLWEGRFPELRQIAVA